MRTILSFFILLSSLFAAQPETITFKSVDGLIITADYYKQHPDTAPLIILFHQAGWSRGEYVEIAPKLNKMGFNCLAIDQRSGKEVNNVKNETFLRAEKAGLRTTYLDALQDMEAALLFARDSLGYKNILTWGSSYSAALNFVLAEKYQKDIRAMLAFAPGEYFVRAGKTSDFIQKHAAQISIPVFVTSAKTEYKNWEAIFKVSPSKHKVKFIPKTEGNHGSRALWEKFDDSPDYWEAVTSFLKEFNHPAQ